jgi:hypothetical protein
LIVQRQDLFSTEKLNNLIPRTIIKFGSGTKSIQSPLGEQLVHIMLAKFPPALVRTSSLRCLHSRQSTLPVAGSIGTGLKFLYSERALVPLLIFRKYFIPSLNHAYAVEVLSQLLFAMVHSSVVEPEPEP